MRGHAATFATLGVKPAWRGLRPRAGSHPANKNGEGGIRYAAPSLRSASNLAAALPSLRLALPAGSHPANKNGEGGIRTRGTRKGTRHFQCRPIGHSGTSPYCCWLIRPRCAALCGCVAVLLMGNAGPEQL